MSDTTSAQVTASKTSGVGVMVGIHLLANAALLWLGYYWLGVAESRTLTLVWSAVVALTVVCLACWLHGAAFAGFRGASLRIAFRQALRHLLPVLLVALAIAALYGLLQRWAEYSGQPVFKIASYLTLKLRKPVKPATVQRVFDGALWLVRWMILPVFLLPVVSGVAGRGWAGFGEIGSRARAWRYWLAVPVLLMCAFWAPFRLLSWRPHLGGFAMEMVSFSLRLLLAYALFVGAWLLLVFLTASGSLTRRKKPVVA